MIIPNNSCFCRLIILYNAVGLPLLKPLQKQIKQFSDGLFEAV
ncbi:hypothetical protein l13_09430 [Neisseria weaveri ATCC 51223]|nr:hypothetical protein l13_09430 [Neisseria weaveri ATCC 51223]